MMERGEEACNRLFGEGRTRGRRSRAFGRGGFAAVKPLDQVGEEAPEKNIARIAADAADLAAIFNEHEDRREALAFDESEVG